MTERYMIERLLEHGRKMHELQKQYFAQKDLKLKRKILIEAKTSEREFDNVVFNIQQIIK